MAHYYSPPASFDDQGRRLTPSERFARPNGSPFLSETHTRMSATVASTHDNAVPLAPPLAVTPATHSPATSSPKNGFSSDGSGGVSPYTPATSATTSPIAYKSYETNDVSQRPVLEQLQPPFGYASQTLDQDSSSPRQSEDRRVKLPSDDERNAQLKDARHANGKSHANGSDSAHLKSPKKKSFFGFSRRGSTAPPDGAHERDIPRSNGQRKSLDNKRATSAISDTEQTDIDDPSTSKRARPKSRSFASAIAPRSKSLGRSSEPVQSESVADGRKIYQSAIRMKASSSSSTSLARRSSSSSLDSEWILLTQQQNKNKANGSFGPGNRSASSLNSSESFAIVQTPGLPPVPLPPTPGKEGQHRSMPIPQTPSPVKSKHHRIQSPAMSPTPAAPFTPERNAAQSPPFYLRNQDSPIQRPAQSSSSRTSASHPGMASPLPSPLSPRGSRPLPTPPSQTSPTAAMTSYRNGAAQLQHVQPHHSSMPPRPGLNRSSQPPWPAEAHVFGKTGQAIHEVPPPPPLGPGPRATLSPNRPSLEQQCAPLKLCDILPPSPALSKPHSPLGRSSPSSESGHGTRVHSPLQPSPSRSRTSSNNSKRGDVIRADSDAQSLSQRQRVPHLLQAHRIRKSSLRSSSLSASPAASACEETPCTGKPRIEEALIKYPSTILASVLGHLNYHACRALLQASSSLWSAAQADQGEFAEVVLQGYLGSYGYLPAAPQAQLPEAVRLTMSDLHFFLAGMDMSVSEYAIFANEHRTGAVSIATIRLLRASTRAYNKLVCRLRLQNAKVHLFLPILQSHWARPTSRYPVSLYKPGRCAIFRVWVPCATQWMTDAELVECEREVYRSGVWNLLRKGDLVRNVALSDIANEGITIFDGKYLRDLSYVHDTIGHLPSWVNGLAFSPSHYHNQIASSTSMPVIFLDLSPFQAQMQRNLKLCKEKVDMSSPSGETYKVSRYVYRTVVDLVAGTVLDSALQHGIPVNNETDVLHNDWIGQIVIETEGTSEAANALIQRVTPLSRKVTPNQPRLPASVNNRPYRVVRHQSRPGLIFVRPFEEKAHQSLQRG